MKKLKILLLVLLYTGIVNAQTTTNNTNESTISKFNFGIRFNPLVSFLKTNGTGIDAKGVNIGFSYGGMGQYNFAKNYALAFELRITQLWNGFTLNSTPTDSAINFKLQYLELPLMLKMHTNEIGYTTYFGEFGLGSGFAINKRYDYRYGNNATVKDKEFKDINDFRFALIIGLGAQYSPRWQHCPVWWRQLQQWFYEDG